MSITIEEIMEATGITPEDLEDNHPCQGAENDLEHETHNFPNIQVLAFCVCQKWQVIEVLGVLQRAKAILPIRNRALKAINIHGEVRLFTEAM